MSRLKSGRLVMCPDGSRCAPLPCTMVARRPVFRDTASTRSVARWPEWTVKSTARSPRQRPATGVRRRRGCRRSWLLRRLLLQPDGQPEIRAAGDVAANDLIDELPAGAAETSHSTDDGHWTGLRMRTVDHQARTVIQKVEPRGEERRSRARNDFRYRCGHRPALSPTAYAAGIVWVVALCSFAERTAGKDPASRQEAVAPTDCFRRDTSIVPPGATVDGDIPGDPIVRTGSQHRPKSTIFRRPPSVTIALAAFKSRWTTP